MWSSVVEDPECLGAAPSAHPLASLRYPALPCELPQEYIGGGAFGNHVHKLRSPTTKEAKGFNFLHKDHVRKPTKFEVLPWA